MHVGVGDGAVLDGGALLLDRQLGACIEIVVPGPGVVGIGKPSFIEHGLVVVQDDRVEENGNAVAVSIMHKRLVIDGVEILELHLVLVGLEVHDQAGGQVGHGIGMVEPEYIGTGTGGQSHLQLGPVVGPGDDRHVHLDACILGLELGDHLLVDFLTVLVPIPEVDRFRFLRLCFGSSGRKHAAKGHGDEQQRYQTDSQTLFHRFLLLYFNPEHSGCECDYSLMPDKAMPSMKYRWLMMKTTTIGSETTTAAVSSRLSLVRCWPCRLATAIDKVYFCVELITTNGQRKSFQLKTRHMMPVASRALWHSGRRMDQKILKCPAPSR
ncbi:hypothetical protein SDC9_87514 [bioreactor metagenome]|uniref:Uncharacterized protein n=1 Tax=bioreactor metagenome TaxID=1076179 RepID=A0A644ZJ25_9ZZZZ